MSNEINFASLNLAQPLLQAIEEVGYTSPTPVQAQAIPLILAGRDILAGAQTGTGKTAGFTLPILQLLTNTPSQEAGKPRCLILVPTRELAAQVGESVLTYGKHLKLTSMVMYGGVSINPQIKKLKKPIDILIATPGRLLDHVSQQTLNLSAVEILVLDEADRMLDMGFIRDISRILEVLPAKRQNLLFSATFADEIRELSEKLLNNPGYVEVARPNATSDLIEQKAHLIPQRLKSHLLAHLIKHYEWQQVLVFTRTKHGANRLAEKLAKNDIPAAAIHGNKSQAARTKALAQFKDGTLPVLVATDIAARGLDIDLLPHVVNFELPNIPEDYVHRIGRTGRAGSNGSALSLVAEDELPYLQNIEKLIKHEIARVTFEHFEAPVDLPPEQPRPPRPQQAPKIQVKIEVENNKSAAKKKPKKRPMSEAARHQAMAKQPTYTHEPLLLHHILPSNPRGGQQGNRTTNGQGNNKGGNVGNRGSNSSHKGSSGNPGNRSKNRSGNR